MDFFRPYGTFFVLGSCPAMNRWAIFARPSGTANREFVLPGTWNRLAKEGEPADIILQTASSLAANLIVMTTDGPEDFSTVCEARRPNACCARRTVRSRTCLWVRCWAEATIANAKIEIE